jgi:hypothetical protein
LELEIILKRDFLLQDTVDEAGEEILGSRSSMNPDESFIPDAASTHAASTHAADRSEALSSDRVANLMQGIIAGMRAPVAPIALPDSDLSGNSAVGMLSDPLRALSDSNAVISARKQPKRLKVEDPADILHFSTSHAGKSSIGARQHALRWRDNARGGVSTAAAAHYASSLGTAKSTDAFSHKSMTPSVAHSTEIVPFPAHPPQVIVDENARDVSPPAPESHAPFPLPLGTKESPFDQEGGAPGGNA